MPMWDTTTVSVDLSLEVAVGSECPPLRSTVLLVKFLSIFMSACTRINVVLQFRRKNRIKHIYFYLFAVYLPAGLIHLRASPSVDQARRQVNN